VAGPAPGVQSHPDPSLRARATGAPEC
jgi:hypothetical protein